MDITLMVHVAAGALAMVFGFVALYSAKGAVAHRKTGNLFVYVILIMGVTGTALALIHDKSPAVNIPAAVLTSYAALTALTTVRPSLAGSRRLNLATLLVALAVGIANYWMGAQAITNGGKRDGLPAFPFFLFGTIGLLGALGDYRVLTQGVRKGRAKIARHLWRMCFALFVASISLSVRTRIVPHALRAYRPLMIPVLAVLVTMIYWLWRIRRKKTFRRPELRTALEVGA